MADDSRDVVNAEVRPRRTGEPLDGPAATRQRIGGAGEVEEAVGRAGCAANFPATAAEVGAPDTLGLGEDGGTATPRCPMDLVYDELLRRQRADPGPASWHDLTGPLVTHGIPEEALRQAVGEWVALGLIIADPDADTLRMEPR